MTDRKNLPEQAKNSIPKQKHMNQKTKKIFRTEKNRNYSVIINAVFQDKRLSWGAKGVMGYALTKPDDWTLYIQDVVKQGTDKVHSVSKFFKELRLAGYFKYNKIYENGRIVRTEYVISESPAHSDGFEITTRYKKKKLESKKLKSEILIQENLKEEILGTEILQIENQALLNTDFKVNTDINKIHEKKKVIKEKEKAVSEEPISETPVSPSSAILDSIPEKTEVTPQEKADAFIAEYKRLYKEKEGIALIDRYVFTITDSIGKVLDFDLTKLQTLFENYKRSWWTVEKNIRATPDNVFKFLDKSSDSLKSEFKGQEKSRYKDENGNYTNQDGASEWYKRDWARMREEAEQRASQPMTPEDLKLLEQF